MITNSWTSSVSGDWNAASSWSLDTVPDDPATDAVISQPGSYVVTIASGKTETVDAVSIPTVSAQLLVAGVLNLTGAAPATTPLGGGTIVSMQTGIIQGSGALTGSSLINAGTLVANGGPNLQLAVHAPLTNTGTFVADNGDLIVAEGLTNLSGTTLTGGTYIASGFIPRGATSVAKNVLAFGFNTNAVFAVDDATIILDGSASGFEGYTGVGTGSAGLVPLEDQLQTIAAGGTLELLDGRGFIAANALLDAGTLVLGGGTVSTPGLTMGGGTLTGYGVVTGPLTNQGAVIASGGTLGSLDLQSPVAGAGTVTVLDGSTLLLAGGSVSTLNVGGLLYSTGTLSVSGTATGTGTIAVERGGGLELGADATPSVSFAGSNVMVTLDQPVGYQGRLVGFGQGDTLVLDGLRGSSASVINGDTLAVMAGGTTLDTIPLAGNYTGATFTATTAGNTTVVTNTAGAPPRDGLSIKLVSVSNSIGLSGSLVAAFENEVSLAAANWGQYIAGAVPLRVSLTFINSGDFGSELGEGAPGALVANGQTIDGHAVFIPDSLYALETGQYAGGTSTDLRITVIASATNLNSFYFDTDLTSGAPPPVDKVDLVSLLSHEIGHGLGFSGVAIGVAPASGVSPIPAGADEAIYDSFIQDTTINGTVVATFDGPNAEAAYGAAIGAAGLVPVPLYAATGSLAVESFYHVNSNMGVPLSSDLMSPFLGEGSFIPISNIDLGILQDTGVPVTANVECFARGTRIETTRGPVAVEDLKVRDEVITMRGVARPVIWIGQRRVDCRRHPRSERVLPVWIAAEAFGPGVPSRDLILSPNHAIYVRDVLIPVYCLRNDITVMQLDRDSIDYFHLELQTHDIVLAEGLPVESYLDCGNRSAFANGGRVTMLFADFAAGDNWEMSGYAPLVLRGPEVEATRMHLFTRAAALAQAAEAFAGSMTI